MREVNGIRDWNGSGGSHNLLKTAAFQRGKTGTQSGGLIVAEGDQERSLSGLRWAKQRVMRLSAMSKEKRVTN